MGEVRIDANNVNNPELTQLRQQEAAIAGELGAAQQQQDLTSTSRDSENARIDLQISENDASFQSAVQDLSNAQNSQNSAQINLNNAHSEESDASSSKSQMDANLTTANGAVITANDTYGSAQTQQIAAQSELSAAASAYGSQQFIVNACESDVSSAQSELSAAESQKNNKQWWEKAVDWVVDKVTSLINAAKALLNKAIEAFNNAKKKLDEFFRVKVDKEKTLEYKKGITEQAKSKLESKKQERDKAKELANAAQVILDAKTGARLVSEQEFASAIAIVQQAQSEKALLDAKVGELQTKKTEAQEKYDALLESINGLIEGKQVELQDIQARIAALEAEAEKMSEEIAIESELDAQLASLGCQIAAQNETQGFGGNVTSLFGGGVIGMENDFLAKKALLEEAIESGDSTALAAAYKSIMGEDLTQEKLNASKEAAEVATALGYGLPITFEDGSYALVTPDILNNVFKEQANMLIADLEANIGGQGWLGATISFCNKGLDIGTNENEAKAKVEEYKNLIARLDTCKDPNEYAALYKAITGESFSLDSLGLSFNNGALNLKEEGGLFNGESKVAKSFGAEAVYDYDATQKAGKDIVCGVGTALVVVGAVALAPFTGGGSLAAMALTTGFAAGVGGATMLTLKATDAIALDGSGWNYSLEQGLRDFGSGAIQGALVPLTGGARGVGGIAGSMTKALGKTTLSTVAKGTITGMAVGGTYGTVYSAGNYLAQTAGTENFSWEGLGKVTATGFVAGTVGGGFGGAVNSVVRPLLINGSNPALQILGKLASGGTTGFVAGGTGGFAAGSTGYLWDGIVDGKEMSFDDWLNASMDGAKMGAAIGAFTGVLFEAVNIATTGAPDPDGTVRTRTETLDDGTKVKNYYNKSGEIIAQDFKASDMAKIFSKDNIQSTDRIIRINGKITDSGQIIDSLKLSAPPPVSDTQNSSALMKTTGNTNAGNANSQPFIGSNSVDAYSWGGSQRLLGIAEYTVKPEGAVATEMRQNESGINAKCYLNKDGQVIAADIETDRGVMRLTLEGNMGKMDGYEWGSNRIISAQRQVNMPQSYTDNASEISTIGNQSRGLIPIGGQNNLILPNMQNMEITTMNPFALNNMAPVNINAGTFDVSAGAIAASQASAVITASTGAAIQPTIAAGATQISTVPVTAKPGILIKDMGSENINGFNFNRWEYTTVNQNGGTVIMRTQECSSVALTSSKLDLPQDYIKKYNGIAVETTEAVEIPVLASRSGEQDILIEANLLKEAVKLSGDKGYGGRIILRTPQVDPENSSIASYYKDLGLRFVDTRHNALMEQFLQNGGELPERLMGQSMYLPKENIDTLLGYGTSEIQAQRYGELQDKGFSKWDACEIAQFNDKQYQVCLELPAESINKSSIQEIAMCDDKQCNAMLECFETLGKGTGYKIGFEEQQNNAGKEIVVTKSFTTEGGTEITLTGRITDNAATVYERQEKYSDGSITSWRKGADTSSFETSSNNGFMTSQIEIINSPQTGEPVQVRSTKASKLLPGVYETTVYDFADYNENYDVISAIRNNTISGGTPLSTVVKNNDGSIAYKENLTANGVETQRTYTQLSDDSGAILNQNYNYKIVDQQGSALLDLDRSFVKNPDGTTTTTINGKQYVTSFDDAGMVLKIDDGSSVKIINLQGKIEDPQLWTACKNLPVDLLYDIDKNVNTWTLCENSDSEYNYADNSLKTGTDTTIIAHELGHARSSALGELCNNPELIEIYNEEISKYNNALTQNTKDYTQYFSQTGGGFTNTGLDEVIAETRALLTTYGHSTQDITTRAQLLTQHFPKTIAYIANEFAADAAEGINVTTIKMTPPAENAALNTKTAGILPPAAGDDIGVNLKPQTLDLLQGNNIISSNNAQFGTNFPPEVIVESSAIEKAGFKIKIDNNEITINSAARKKLKELRPGSQLTLGEDYGGTSHIHVSGESIEPRHLTITKTEDGNYRITNEYPGKAPIKTQAQNSAEVSALKYYKDAVNGFRHINEALDIMRDGGVVNDTEILGYIENLTNLISDSPLETGMILYRGEGYEVLDSVVMPNGEKLSNMLERAAESADPMKIEKVIEMVLDDDYEATQSHFMSTSSTMDKAFLNKPILWTLSAKEGTKAVSVENFVDSARYYTEKEYLLQRGSKIIIKSIEYDYETKRWLINAEVRN